MKHRILFLINSFEADAPNQIVAAIARAAHDSGRFDCTVAAMSRDGALKDELTRHEIRAVFTGMPGQTRLGAVTSMYSCIRKLSPHILQTSLTFPTLAGLTAAKFLKVPVRIAIHHGSHEFYQRGPLLGWMVSAAYGSAGSLATEIVAVSRAVRSQLIACGIPEQKVSVIYNGTDPEKFRPSDSKARQQVLETLFPDGLPADAILIGSAGNLRSVKGHWQLVEAAKPVLDRFPNARFVVWGEGPERGRLETMIRQEGISGSFVLPGHADGLANLLPACDVFVQPSLEEAFGLSVVEAMACQVPVIVSDAGALGEVVNDGMTGHVFARGNTMSLAQKLIRALGESSASRQTGIAARECVTMHFTRTEMVQQYLALYDRLVRVNAL